jgi:endonuclease I
MKKIFTLVAFLFFLNGNSQIIPQGYYDGATGTGYQLKTQLFNIINNNTNTNNSPSDYGELWTLFTQSAFRDQYYDFDNTLLDIYTEIPTAADSYSYSTTSQQCGSDGYNGEGDCYNREHTLPQSVWSSAYPMYSDAHFVLPTDGKVNGVRDNYPYGKVNNASWTSSNGSKLGSNLNSGYSAGYSGTVFEPINEFKGDIARCLLYFATRYEDQITNWSYTMFNGTSNQVFTNTFLNILITWNNLDPVSQYEIVKNHAVYTFQGNRNPFIDHPEYVCQIWSAACSTLATDSFQTATISVFPNPTNNHSITIESINELDKIQLITVNGQILKQITNPILQNKTYTIDNLQPGFYFLKVFTKNEQQITKKILVN